MTVRLVVPEKRSEMQSLTKVNEVEYVGHTDPISISMGSTHQDVSTYEDWWLLELYFQRNWAKRKVYEAENVGHSDPISI